MAFLSLTLSALLSAANPSLAPVADMACRFETGETETTWISVRPDAQSHRPGLFEVRMWIAGRPLAGRAIALDKTKARDVVIRGVTPDRTIWLMAIRDDGMAFLRTRAGSADGAAIAKSGSCSHYESAFEVWLAS